MSRYLFQASYTSESWKAQLVDQPDVLARITPVVEACNGMLESLYYSFGDSDVMLIVEFPTHEDAASFSLAVAAGGAVSAVRTTPLLTVEEGRTAMSRASRAGGIYRPPIRA